MFWTIRQTALFLGVDPSHVYYLIGMGEIEAVKVSWLWRIVPESVRAYGAKMSA